MPNGFKAAIDASTRFCAVLGHPVCHSASPAMQNAALAALNLNWRYLAFDVLPDGLAAAIQGARAMGFIGLNLTVPHKLAAVGLVDELDPRAKLCGAVNTIVFEARAGGQTWKPLGRTPVHAIEEVRAHGFNTDADAIVKSIIEDFAWPELGGASVVLLGAGGAARTAALRLAQESIQSLFLVNRTTDKAAELAREAAIHCPSLEVHIVVEDAAKAKELKKSLAREHPDISIVDALPECRVDLLLNATSLGLQTQDPLPVDLNWLQSWPPRRVYDMIYRPAQTALLREAKEAGCAVANGASMLLYQGETALELWTQEPAPVEVMRAALEHNLYGQPRGIDGPHRL